MEPREQDQIQDDPPATKTDQAAMSQKLTIDEKLQRMRELGFKVEDSSSDSGPVVIVGTPPPSRPRG